MTNTKGLATASSKRSSGHRVLFAIKSMQTLGGGAERVLSVVSAGLADRGHDVTIVTLDPPDGESFYPIAPAVERLDLDLNAPGTSVGIHSLVQSIAALRRAAASIEPAVAIGFMHSMFIPLGIALKGAGIPVVASEHISFDHYIERRTERWLVRLLSSTYGAASVPSERVRQSYPPPLARRMTVIPNPIDVPMSRPAMPQVPASERSTLLSVGRLSEQKDHMCLIRAFARLAADFPDWDLVIVGDGELRASLEDEIAVEGLGGRIRLPGVSRCTSEDYANAQLFAVPSRYESFGLATAEALAHGLPAIGFADCPGTNELIQHDVNGLLVEGGDRTSALEGGLRRLMRDGAERLRLGESGPAALRGHRPSEVTGAWEHLLRGVVAND